ncbi:MAG: aminomethyl-transferring glycine dehydrogenase subunit GcvPA [Anaerolineae bacterium]|nr:aminomethyl-transferring glycine dehydrogenase subunit GcvPA [Anaerolineae bacterium]
MFIPHTTQERTDMLKAIGLEHVSDLFIDIPAEHRYPDIKLPKGISEMEVMDHIHELSSANESLEDLICFLGAGAYRHYIPAVVDGIIQDGSFYSAYTPYQPEISQGTLQAIYEYQSLIAALTGMEASNASHYDGATAAAEACILAYHQYRGKRTKFILSRNLHPHYQQVIRTYLEGFEDTNIVVVDGYALADFQAEIDNNTALVYVQYPDFLGKVIEFDDLVTMTHQAGALFAVSANPIALALLKSPAEFGADIVTGEGQPLGIPLSYGGPYLGFFATRKELIRKIAGRIVGETVDQDGKRGYVLTLTAREQHIRREKATSNICTNQGLIALAATVYLSALGKNGLIHVAESCYQKAHYAARQISQIPGYKVDTDELFFHEFVVSCPSPVREINEHLLSHQILGGLDLSSLYPDLKNPMLLAVTESNDKTQIDYLCEVLSEARHV